jgi:hypothetical protein
VTAVPELAADGAGDIDAARRLPTRLGSLPLALWLAGRYLEEVTSMPPSLADPGDAISFDNYTATLDHRRHREATTETPASSSTEPTKIQPLASLGTFVSITGAERMTAYSSPGLDRDTPGNSARLRFRARRWA